MNTLTTRQITPADVLAERAVRAKVLYSPCADQDIKWRWCDCYVCRSVWDPTGEQDAARANAARQAETPVDTPGAPMTEPVTVPALEIPTSLPPPAGSNESVTLTGTEVNTAIRYLEGYKEQMKRSIGKIVADMESKTTEDYLPIAPPELDNLLARKTSLSNLIDALKKKERSTK